MKNRAGNRLHLRQMVGTHLRIMLFGCIMMALMAAGLWYALRRQQAGPVSFGSSILQGNIANNPTSLQFGPDGRLYVAEQYGRILIYTVVRLGPNDYRVQDIEQITLIQQIPNHEDDTGVRNYAINQRQVTGIVVAGSSQFPVIYVSSSDPRIGAGGGGQDLNLDTNSGTISRLSWDGSQWNKVDLVRGLPRSEENHACNGMHLSTTGDTLFVTSAGLTNAGGPSGGFAFITEYALGVAILSIDLNALNTMPLKTDPFGQQYLYDLPTLDDPDKPNVNGITDPNDPAYDGIDVGDPFGGNDGLNQAKLVPGSPVQIYSPGYRNAYDIEITTAGRMYTVDNGGNGGWGGYPEGEGTPNVTNNYVPGEPGYVNNLNGLHYVPDSGYYAGHPCPVRANPTGAGLYTYGDSGVFRTSTTGPHPLPADWPPVPPSMANPLEGDFQLPGVENQALIAFPSSTNGLCEYTASNFGGALQGNLLAASYTGEIYRVQLNAAGDTVTNGIEVFFSGFGMQPLDVTAQGDAHIFGGTIWVADYGNNNLYVFEPADYDGASVPACAGTDDPTLDEDLDGFSNADELDNSTNPCSSASKPADRDSTFINGFLVSDLNDPDDDDDGLPDTTDPFPIDPLNGLQTRLPFHREFFNDDPGTGFFGLGFTGLMQPGQDYLSLYDAQQVIAGGTTGLLTIPAEAGDPRQNNQRAAFQFGMFSHAGMCPYVIHTQMLAAGFEGQSPDGPESQGMYIGTGDQDNYVKIVADSGISVIVEVAGVPSVATYSVPNIRQAATIDLYLTLDPAAGSVQPEYALEGGPRAAAGAAFALGGSLLTAVQDSTQALAIGLLASTGGGKAFYASWDELSVQPLSTSSSATLRIDPPGNQLDASCMSSGSFQLTNTSAGGQKIKEVRVDLRTAWLQKLVFDPTGQAGDEQYMDVRIDAGGSSTGFQAHSFSAARDGGYEVLSLSFSDFDAGESLQFSVDVDPLSVQGTTAPGPGQAAHVSGLELAGSRVYLQYDDCSSQEVLLYPDSSQLDASLGQLSGLDPPQATLGVQGMASFPATTEQAGQVAVLNGPAGAEVSLYLAEAEWVAPNLPSGAYSPDLYEANRLLQLTSYTATIGTGGQVEIPFNLLRSQETGGRNLLLAVLSLPGGGSFSLPPLQLLLKPALCSVHRINCGGPAYTTVAGELFEADAFYSGGSIFSVSNNIANTPDDALYQSERYAANLSYDLPVPTVGNYEVRLHFAEIWYGQGAGSGGQGGDGSRVFDIYLEGGLVKSQHDIHAAVGPNTAQLLTYQVNVADGNLDIDLLASQDQAKLSAIEVLQVCSQGGVLPLELLRFEAGANGQGVRLLWEAKGVEQQEVFEAEYATDGRNFRPFFRMQAAVSHRAARQYEAFHAQPRVGKNYYRLKMVDVQGNVQYSPIREVRFRPTFVAYPNPLRRGEKLHVQLPNPPAGPVHLRLVSLAGKTVFSQTHTFLPGQTHLGISLPPLGPGSYLLLLETRSSGGLQHYLQRLLLWE